MKKFASKNEAPIAVNYQNFKSVARRSIDWIDISSFKNHPVNLLAYYFLWYLSQVS